ncbi:hypothetical protein NQD34_016684 [Periophthalmus magnuspinnatus]|nr:hypothetical protein NQD34_016684 [Periophthalmus magnuspinnatus]
MTASDSSVFEDETEKHGKTNSPGRRNKTGAVSGVLCFWRPVQKLQTVTCEAGAQAGAPGGRSGRALRAGAPGGRGFTQTPVKQTNVATLMLVSCLCKRLKCSEGIF